MLQVAPKMLPSVENWLMSSGMQTKPTVLWEDNNGCLSVARTGHYRGRSKHFALRFQFISDYIDRGLLNLRYVASKDQLADLGTKACPWPQLQRMRPRLYGEAQLVSADS